MADKHTDKKIFVRLAVSRRRQVNVGSGGTIDVQEECDLEELQKEDIEA